MSDQAERFPIFPLPIVLLPSEIAPLHIFEERYKTMMDECLEADSEFGIAWLGEEGLAETGCTAAITDVLERTEDGRMNILVKGNRPFRLLRRVDDMAYPAGDIELLADSEPADDERTNAARLMYADVVERATGQRPDSDDLDGLDSYGMAATVELEAQLKQRMLDIRSEPDRLELLEELLRNASDRMDQAEKVADVARSNGKAKL